MCSIRFATGALNRRSLGARTAWPRRVACRSDRSTIPAMSRSLPPAADLLISCVSHAGWARQCIVTLCTCTFLLAFVRVSSAQGLLLAARSLRLEAEQLSEEVNDPTAMLTQVRFL